MVESIKGVSVAQIQEAISKQQISTGAGSFTSLLQESIAKVSEVQVSADKAIEGLAKGEATNVHEAMIAVEEANLSFNMMLQVRNKLLAAYEEIMRMQL
ncbi:MAG: flagellar hook-basal body complex protein FliE [Proteobacteria bacterium]|nr:flagellar hook-basal body complex protein FliE [Pseudomonadota bacterium]